MDNISHKINWWKNNYKGRINSPCNKKMHEYVIISFDRGMKIGG